MGLSPIPDIRNVGSASELKPEREVSPAIGVNRAGRAGDDTYNAHGNHGQRGMEEEDSEPEKEVEAGSDAVQEDSTTSISFFA